MLLVFQAPQFGVMFPISSAWLNANKQVESLRESSEKQTTNFVSRSRVWRQWRFKEFWQETVHCLYCRTCSIKSSFTEKYLTVYIMLSFFNHVVATINIVIKKYSASDSQLSSRSLHYFIAKPLYESSFRSQTIEFYQMNFIMYGSTSQLSYFYRFYSLVKRMTCQRNDKYKQVVSVFDISMSKRLMLGQNFLFTLLSCWVLSYIQAINFERLQNRFHNDFLIWTNIFRQEIQ